MSKLENLRASKVILGPYVLFDGSFVIEFLEVPANLNATVLMRATYKLNQAHLGKSHPQRPPLHLHFDQSESFIVTQGSLGTTDGWRNKDHIWTPANTTTPIEIRPYEPHTFWPDPNANEDGVAYIWAHPEGVPEPMDHLFFASLLRFIGDVTDGKRKMDVLYVMTNQHASATAMVMLPTWSWLGPLIWWLPWKFQAVFAFLGKLLGYRALLKEYTPDEDWQAYVQSDRV